MRSLSLTLKSQRNIGTPLPVVYSQLESLGARIRTGQVTLIAGAPGSGKTAFANNWALRLDWTGFGDRSPGIYFSMDSDSQTVGTRVAANVTGTHLSDAERGVRRRDPEMWQKLEDHTSHITWCWSPSPSGQDILDEIECYGYIHGRWPDWIVFDNLMDMAGEDPVALNSALDFGKQIARERGCAVIFLHHCVGEYEDGSKPIPLSGLRYKVGKLPRLILTLWRPDPLLLGVSIVKNSSGRADPSGNYGTNIPMVLEKMQFHGGQQ